MQSADVVLCTFAAHSISAAGAATIRGILFVENINLWLVVSPDGGRRWSGSVALDKEVQADCTPPPNLSSSSGCVDAEAGSISVTGEHLTAVGSGVQCRINDGTAVPANPGGSDTQVVCPVPAGLQPPSATVTVSRETGRWSAPLTFPVSADCNPPAAISASVVGTCLDDVHGSNGSVICLMFVCRW